MFGLYVIMNLGDIMELIETIDLWTERGDNMQECFDGAFSDGFGGGDIPFDSFKVVRHCNCTILTWPRSLNIDNKHNAIVFYKDGEPVRLMVINKNTNVDECINKALAQTVNNMRLVDLFDKYAIKASEIDMHEEPIEKEGIKEEIDVGSSDRASLLKSMIEGSYTEEESSIGVNKELLFLKDRMVRYFLVTDTEVFRIMHKLAFANKEGTRLIPLQTDGFNEIKKH